MRPSIFKNQVAFAFLLGTFLVAPVALADPLVQFDQLPEAEFRVYEGSDYNASVRLLEVKQPTLVHMYIAGPLGTTDQKEYLIESHTYEEDSSYVFSWDGRVDDQYLKAGKYELRFKSGGIYQDDKSALSFKFDLTDPFKVVVENNAGSGSANSGTSGTSGANQTGDTGLNFDVESTAPVCAELRVDGNFYKLYQALVAGEYQVSLEELNKIAKLSPGVHEWKLYVDSAKCGGSPEKERVIASGQLKVSNPEADYAAFCGKFSDIQPSDPDCPAIGYVYSIGAMTGYPDGTFRPAKILQRDESAKISLMAFKEFVQNTNYCKGVDPYSDVKVNGDQAAWSAEYVCLGTQIGMITGYKGGEDAGKFIPARLVNMAEFLALILRNLDDSMPSLDSTSYPNVPAGQWYSGFFKYAHTHQLLDNLNVVPTQDVSRREVAKILYKLHLLEKL